MLNEAHRLAQVFVGKSPASMKLGKAAFTRATDNGYRQGAASAVDLLSTVFGTDDCRAWPPSPPSAGRHGATADATATVTIQSLA